MNDLYIWWTNAAPPTYDIRYITVRATFLGGSAHPTQAFASVPSMAIFEGFVSVSDGGSVSPAPFGPFAKGTGTFCQVDNLGNSSFQTGHNIPFKLYSYGTKLALWMNLSSVWSNANNLIFYFDKITSYGPWPSGNWTGLNGGVGSAIGEVTLACSVYAVKIH